LLIVGACTSSGASSAALNQLAVHNMASKMAASIAGIRKRIIPPEEHSINFFRQRKS
jgi:hypothetical protein